MRRLFCRTVSRVVLALALIAVSLPAMAAQSEAVAKQSESPALQVKSKYVSIPKGVVLEGTALGMGRLESVSYNRDTNAFLINGTIGYQNPIEKKEFRNLLKALSESDLLGVSDLDSGMHRYGNMSKSSKLMKTLLATDIFLAGVIWAKEEDIKGVKLPRGYKPKAAEDRKHDVIAFMAFSGFHFTKKKVAQAQAPATEKHKEKGKGKEKEGDKAEAVAPSEMYQRDLVNLLVSLFPASNKKAADGGYLPDDKLLKTFTPHPADQANINHININKPAYFKMEPIASTIRYGEAAAFARTIRNSKLDLKALLKSMN